MSTHLKFVGESYGKHLGFTLKLSCHLLLLCIVSIIHGFIPWVFGGTVSKAVKHISEKLNLRGKNED
jgi:hypothetical protein